MSEVYIVHCVDTEGPMYESLESTFQRLESIFGIKLPVSYENLQLLQEKKIPLHGLEDAVASLVAGKRIELNATWEQIDSMLDVIGSNRFRNALTDSNGNGWVYNWFCMDHVGFTGENPRRRDAGHHRIFDHYTKWFEKTGASRDDIQWHYHPLPYNGNYHGSGLAYLNSKNVWEVLSRKIIDRHWFPSAFRPGFHAERPDSHWFLEQWIPFDLANQATELSWNCDQPDLAGGRWGDWRRAPTQWDIYHPSHDDYQVRGNCRRWIARCLNMEARIREITTADMIDGFRRASEGLPTLISFTNHDFRNMVPEIEKIRAMIRAASNKYPDIRFYFSRATDAFRRVLGLTASSSFLRGEFKILNLNAVRLEVTSERELFGPQPYLAIKTTSGDYLWENFDFQEKNQWSFVFDDNHIHPSKISKIGIAANSPNGVADIIIFDVATKEWTSKVLHQ